MVKVAVQSYCYRNFKSIDALLEQLRLTGATRLELC